MASLDSKDPLHAALTRWWATVPKSLVSFIATEACLTEVNFLLPKGAKYRQLLSLFLEELKVKISPLDLPALVRINDLMDRYSDLPMDFADATIVYACEQNDIKHVLTTDRRDFQIYQPRHCSNFILLPEQP